MKKCVILTTINCATEAVYRLFILLKPEHYDLIVVGDRKTPHCPFYRDNCIYLDVEMQQQQFGTLQIPFNHYCRKNFGYLYAVTHGYQRIYETDDDNIPYDNIVQFLRFDTNRVVNKVVGKEKTINVYNLFTDKFIWPRGLPLNEISKRENIITEAATAANVVVIQSLVDNDPDVDAIYRLTHSNNQDFCFTKTGLCVALAPNIYSPFNTQATLWIDRQYFYLLYVPCTTDFRYCDILRGYVAQRCLWEKQKTLAFCDAFVYQKRNEHDYMLDFRGEIRMYTTVEALIGMLNNIQLCGDKNDLILIYSKCVELNIVKPQELAIISQWLSYFSNE